jgi:hypothetical protein
MFQHAINLFEPTTTHQGECHGQGQQQPEERQEEQEAEAK